MDEMLSPKGFQEADASGQWRVLGDGACSDEDLADPMSRNEACVSTLRTRGQGD
jgi:hypothetical protein